MAHGFYVDDVEIMRSSLITPEEVAASRLDYLALGHVHVFTDITHGQTRACYPGTPAPLHMGAHETGSVVVVNLDPESGVRLSQQALHFGPA
jgi:DNA repair exonuclease SbcCD nuclease subunit